MMRLLPLLLPPIPPIAVPSEIWRVEMTIAHHRSLNLSRISHLGLAVLEHMQAPLSWWQPELEELVARFVGKLVAITFGMGYVANWTIIPSLVREGGLVISDSFNHNSIVNGARASSANVSIFQHNSIEREDSEGVARHEEAMKKDNCHCRRNIQQSHSTSNSIARYISMLLPCHHLLSNKISAIKVVLGEDGSDRGAKKLTRVHKSSNYFRSELKKMCIVVLGGNNSPITSIMLYNLAKLPAFLRECLSQKVAVVIVAYPATPVLIARDLVEKGFNDKDVDEGRLKENRKKDSKALFILQQAMHETIFSRIATATFSKEAWEILHTKFQGSSRVIAVKL
ncbi:hypothetical protein ZIOFF_011254 [Zingiber officinale]|uniref:serine C-palmitoyltransferase n=1 Tax=Zingiber officinale TaxID=94328 RepID=A0A8J5I7Q0_ZINOF|nr:hypothetical protein ZIOFF_011254 [Zingiber officinale]